MKKVILDVRQSKIKFWRAKRTLNLKKYGILLGMLSKAHQNG